MDSPSPSYVSKGSPPLPPTCFGLLTQFLKSPHTGDYSATGSLGAEDSILQFSKNFYNFLNICYKLFTVTPLIFTVTTHCPSLPNLELVSAVRGYSLLTPHEASLKAGVLNSGPGADVHITVSDRL